MTKPATAVGVQWVCWKRGVYFNKVEKDYTGLRPASLTQVCPQCDTHTGKKELKDRIHSCQSCGYTTHRDVAAAQVIRNRGETALQEGFPTAGDCVRPWRAAGIPEGDLGALVAAWKKMLVETV